MLIKIDKLIFFLLPFLILVSCKQEQQEVESSDPVSMAENEITLSDNQKELAGIQMGQLQKKIISEVVECSGNIEVPPQSLASVNAPLGGFVKEARFYVGNFVEKGTVLAILEHQNYISLQQKYLEAKSEMEYFKEEYKRQGELSIEDAASLKKMQKAKTDYEKSEAIFLSLKSQLEMIGINPDSIKNTGIQSTIGIKAPISGYISEINANIGKYMNENEPLYEIVNKDHLHLHLKVFENDVLKIKKGQHITFSIAGDSKNMYDATINTISQNVDENERTINVHAHLEENISIFKPGMFVNATVELSGDSVYVLPSTAFINEGDQNYIFKQNTSGYLKTPIEKGIIQGDLVQILNPSQELIKSNVVTNGAYYLNAEMENED